MMIKREWTIDKTSEKKFREWNFSLTLKEKERNYGTGKRFSRHRS